MTKIMHIILVMATYNPAHSFVDAELDWLGSKTLSPSAEIAYRGEVARLSTYCEVSGIRGPAHLQPENWVRYIECLSLDRTAIDDKLRPLKTSSVLQAIRITRAFLLHCRQRGYVDWEPRDVTFPSTLQAAPKRTERDEAALPPSVRRVLSSPPFSKDVREARRHFAIALGFWGALSPRELAIFTVRDLKISSRTGISRLACAQRQVPVLLPAEVAELWVWYRQCREGDGNPALTPRSPLIANLRNGGALRAWSIWALMQPGDRDEGTLHINPRRLRDAYEQAATRDALKDLDAVGCQIGKERDARKHQGTKSRELLLQRMHDAALKELRVPKGERERSSS